jgi:hypothetical protein
MKKFLEVIGYIVLVVALVAINGFTAMMLWEWFVTPLGAPSISIMIGFVASLGAPSISIMIGAGLYMTATYMTMPTQMLDVFSALDKSELGMTKGTAMASRTLYPIAALGIGYLIQLFV